MGRVYATTVDYQNWSGDTITPPERVTWLLARASEDVDRALIGAVYPVDANSMPTNADDIQTFKDATCAQVAFRLELSDDTGAASRNDSTSIGGISIHRAAGTAALAMPPLGPEALKILHLAGAVGTAAMTNW
ncbi:MAG: hypothetical protein YHS30scaffold324_6 [Catenulispora phage 69_17]|jgi:hypothetical protein|nr:MAG: hypothetical protein YHS30scaffold324_6 [Catenulispora phage 69_17]